MSNESTIPTPATPDVCTAAILIEGTEISGEFHVLSIYITREINRIPTATIHLQDGEAAKATFKASNTEHFIPGKKIEIQLGYRSNNDSVFKGIIVKHSIKIRQSGSLLILECRDEAVKMTCGINSRYYIDKKDNEIIEDIIDLYGLQKDIKETQVAHKEVVQYESSDWDFMLCRAEANGLVVNVENGKIIAVPPATSEQSVLKVQFGATLLELDAEIDARWQSKGITAQSWNATDQEIISSDAAEPSTTDNGNLKPSELADVIGGEAHIIRHGGKLSESELQAWADGRLLKERLTKVRGRAKFQGFAGVLPDKVIEISGIGERFEGKLYVSGIRHSFAKGDWHTDVQLGLTTELFAETYNLRPLPAAGLLPAVSGLQIGIVTVLEDDPEGEDRIKVKIPMISTEDEGIWARLATLDAGNERGTFFRPEIDDEVIIGFLNDDPRYPVILGMCHSSAKPAPEPAKDDNHLKGYVSREKLKLLFDDEKKIITLETDNGNKLIISEEDKGIILEDENNNKITLNDSGIKIESSKEITLKAEKDIKIEGANIELKAQTSFKASGSSSAELSGASTTIKGDSSVEVSGASATLKGDASVEVSGASATLKGDATTTIKGGIVQIN